MKRSIIALVFILNAAYISAGNYCVVTFAERRSGPDDRVTEYLWAFPTDSVKLSPDAEIPLLPFVIDEDDAFAERTGHTYYWLDSVATPGDTRDRPLYKAVRAGRRKVQTFYLASADGRDRTEVRVYITPIRGEVLKTETPPDGRSLLYSNMFVLWTAFYRDRTLLRVIRRQPFARVPYDAGTSRLSPG